MGHDMDSSFVLAWDLGISPSSLCSLNLKLKSRALWGAWAQSISLSPPWPMRLGKHLSARLSWTKMQAFLPQRCLGLGDPLNAKLPQRVLQHHGQGLQHL